MYYYGASIQGIQGFIFATNKLQEIIGASEIVKRINYKFENEIKKLEKNNKTKFVMSAAGNMKAVFYDKDELQKFILKFKKEILNMAYGITFSEAVVTIIGDEPTDEERNNLEENLKVQRNRPDIPIDMSLNITKLAPATAKPLVEIKEYKDNEKEELDKSSQQKRECYELWKQRKCEHEKDENDEKKEDRTKYEEISYLSNSKNKIAVIHIDGNGLGSLIRNLTTPISEFSKNLDKATKEAFKKANKKHYKLREVILGGDDVSVICNADIALQFTKDFLENFEKETENRLGSKLTACGGIAICNEKYPFHYAIDLAEELCAIAKKDSKKINEKLAPSSFMFHNVQSSNFESWDLYVENELTLNKDSEEKENLVRCDFGPYYLDEKDNPEIDDLLNLISLFRMDNAPTSKLRNWLGMLDENSYIAKKLLDRINDVLDKNMKESINKVLKKLNPNLSMENLIVEIENKNKTPIYDVLQIISNTKEIKNEI